MKRTALILAGYSAVGKSTFLQWALFNQIPIFGEELRDDFLSFQLPSVWPENRLSARQKLEEKTWLAGHNLYSIPEDHLPNKILLNLDLLSLHLRRPNANISSAEFKKSYEEYLRTPALKGACIAVNTVKRPFVTVCRQRDKRQMTADRRSKTTAVFFEATEYAKSAFDNAYDAWHAAVREASCNIHLETSFDGLSFQIVEL